MRPLNKNKSHLRGLSGVYYLSMKPTRYNPVSIFDFTDYRLFLRDYYAQAKRQHRGFTYRSFAQLAGTPPSLLKDIISGRRRLTLATARKFGSAMKFSGRQQHYFEVLVHYCNETDNTRRNEFFDKIVQLRGRAGIHFLGEEHYSFFQHWYHAAIRELVTLPEFREDAEWIAEKLHPSITPAQVRKAIKTLCDIGLLQRREGRLVQSDGLISSEYEMSSSVVRGFNRQMIENSLAAMEDVPVARREISGLTLGVSRMAYDRIKQRIRLFKEELLRMAADDTSSTETVCQFNVQLFPLVEEEDDDEKSLPQ
jgi:uncharacterized protein (TIGR02147 family)